jgi:hypothetical protein
MVEIIKTEESLIQSYANIVKFKTCYEQREMGQMDYELPLIYSYYLILTHFTKDFYFVISVGIFSTLKPQLKIWWSITYNKRIEQYCKYSIRLTQPMKIWFTN